MELMCRSLEGSTGELYDEYEHNFSWSNGYDEYDHNFS